ncbi:DUF4258 domain-containing protein [bacterium]
MAGYEFSSHAYDMLGERGILETWVEMTVREPERIENRDDGTTHFIKPIEEFGGRYLRVVVNHNVEPNIIVTLFFDRKLGGRT